MPFYELDVRVTDVCDMHLSDHMPVLFTTAVFDNIYIFLWIEVHLTRIGYWNKQTNQLQHSGERMYNCVIFDGEVSISNLHLLGNEKTPVEKI